MHDTDPRKCEKSLLEKSSSNNSDRKNLPKCVSSRAHHYYVNQALAMRDYFPFLSYIFYLNFPIQLADAIKILAQDNISTQSRARNEGGIPPIVELLEFPDLKVQRAVAGALRTLSFENHENKNQIVECNALPALTLLLCSEDVTIQKEAVSVLEHVINLSPRNIKMALEAGALQPVITLLREIKNFLVSEIWELLQKKLAATKKSCTYPLATKYCVAKTLEMLERKINGRVLSHLLYLMCAADRSIKRRIALALARLCSPEDQESIFIKNRGLHILLDLLESWNLELRQLASEALYKLADKAGSLFPIYLGKEFVNNPTLSDVTFLIEGKPFHAHKIWLLRASDAFQEFFDSGYMEREAQDIEISDIRWEVFELMMRYIYTGSVIVTLYVAHDLLKAAHEYRLDVLKHLCECTIKQNIQVDNFFLTYESSEACNSMVLRDACIVFVLGEFDNLVALPGFLHLLNRMTPEMRDYFIRELSRPIQA
ncbi:hypothetical protein DCAR_0314139 [Daucus carota subsp. sativus]|uniref:BTB domain-containing protein n=1 Tax=Daucus carota subsp. sativus TaxID=79200 RepID=A0AAF0WSB9_DAUCS|nr:hypothetical protein DCAR_0314139 [Daucus carota subsp. sativus]